jgi:uncharacterized phage protein (TIGR02218 family)
MRTIDPALAAHFAGGATTLAHCWRMTRRDGLVLGFTDHDRDLTFDGALFAAASGLDATEATAELGLAVAGGEVAGALTADGLTEAGLEAGLFDAATVETFWVNWADPSERILLAKATIGEVRREDGAFTAELRSAAHRLNQAEGRLYGKRCDADLGDGRCRVDLGRPDLSTTAAVTMTDGRLSLTASAIAAAEAGRFTAGLLRFTSGANQGRAVEVKRHAAGGGLDLWRPMAEAIAPGDLFTVSAGCDKRFATCRDRFANAENFRGFPHIPGNDRILGYAVAGGGNDGQSLGDDDT